ncbi:hypothetical protein C8Q80DRAFT_195711 [Daedaleopsis nitida]|nr:hypothetical protein C8Q80DRAFT_195711 [Daedaleopsis nitida]
MARRFAILRLRDAAYRIRRPMVPTTSVAPSVNRREVQVDLTGPLDTSLGLCSMHQLRSPSNSTMPSVPANLPALQLGIPSLDDTYGALLLGTFVGLMLFGWTAHQFYHYFCTDYGDRWWLKGLIMLVVYFYLVTNYFNPLALASITWSQTVLAITSGLLMVVSQTFFLCRVYIFRRKNRLFVGIVCLVAILLLAELGASLALTIYVSPGRPADNNVEAFITAAGPGIAAAADTIITIALICAVHQSRTGFAKTDTLIDRIVLYAINTGLLTGIVNMAFFICALAMPRNLVYAALGVITSKMYGITLMAA